MGITRRRDTAKAKQEPVIKGVLPDQPAPQPQPCRRAANALGLCPVAKAPAAATPAASGGFFGWVRSVGLAPAAEEPSLEAKPEQKKGRDERNGAATAAVTSAVAVVTAPSAVNAASVPNAASVVTVRQARRAPRSAHGGANVAGAKSARRTRRPPGTPSAPGRQAPGTTVLRKPPTRPSRSGQERRERGRRGDRRCEREEAWLPTWPRPR